jgi:hypothetical protein
VSVIDQAVTSDTDLIECLLPAHLFCLLIERLEARGEWELRPDLEDSLTKEMARLLTPLDTFSVKRVALRVDDTVTALLRAMGADDPRHGLHVAALFTLKLIDEGLHPDPSTQAALVALLVVEEAGEDANWRANDTAARAGADRMLRLARLQGLYTTLPTLVRS